MKKRIDFMIFISVEGANPNGDPLAQNYPRTTSKGNGEITDVCLKRKIRNRWQDMGEDVYVYCKERDFVSGGKEKHRSLTEALENEPDIYKEAKKSKDKRDNEAIARRGCEKWIDVRSFGQVFAANITGKTGDGLSIPVRGPVTLSHAVSIDPVNISDIQITKCIPMKSGTDTKENDEGTTQKDKQDTMGRKYTVEFGLYKAQGSINPYLAAKTGFSDEDKEKLKEALISLFENDEASARPSGSMSVVKLIWWERPEDTSLEVPSPIKVFKSVRCEAKPDGETLESIDDYMISVTPIEGDVEPEVITLV